MIGRREAIAFGVIGGGIAVSSAASACTLIGRRSPVSFSDGACERKIRQFIAFANVAHEKSDNEIFDWNEKNGIEPDYDGNHWKGYNLAKEMRISDGKVDPKPMRIGELELIRQVKNKATYVFILHRNQYFAADEEGCNGMFTHGEYYADTKTAFLATFEDNVFVGIKDFPEWYV